MDWDCVTRGNLESMLVVCQCLSVLLGEKLMRDYT